MKALFSMGETVPLGRAAREHRAWLVPLAAVLAINAGVLLAVVLPLSRAVAANERREQAAQTSLAAGQRDLQTSQALRDGKVQASSDLETFYRQILPGDVAAARRLTHVKLAQLAASHDVLYERGTTVAERLKDSTLARLHVSMSLTGDYADIRAFLHDLETAADFVVIDNMVLAEGAKEGDGLSLTLEVSTYYPAAADAR